MGFRLSVNQAVVGTEIMFSYVDCAKGFTCIILVTPQREGNMPRGNCSGHLVIFLGSADF